MKHYLVIQLARFGDLIQTKRLLSTLCARPEASVHLCIDNSLKALAELVYPDVTIHTVAAHGTGLTASEALTAMLVKNRQTFSALLGIDFDTIFNLNFSGLNFRMAALFDPEKVQGYSWHNGQEIIGLWPTMAMRWSKSRRIAINLVDFWAGYCPDMIDGTLVNPKASPKGGGIGIVLAGRESRRSLPAEQLAAIGTTLSRVNENKKLVLLGSQSEKAPGQAVIKNLPKQAAENTENLAGKTSWSSLIEIVDSLDMLITPDTGTMHLAAHLGTPVKAFFLSSAWCFETGPYGVGHTVYQAYTDCLPCLESTPCQLDIKCLGGFANPVFQRFLVTGKAEHMPEGIIQFNSSFDELGLNFEAVSGIDSEKKQRSAFRSFIRQHLMGGDCGEIELESMLAEKIFRERDYIAEAKSTGSIG